MDNSKKIELTPEGRQKLVEELAYREGEKHDEIVERIKEARGFGDLSENSEYDAAKEEQSHNESRINEIRQILSVATVVAAGSHANLKVSIGTTVTLMTTSASMRARPILAFLTYSPPSTGTSTSSRPLRPSAMMVWQPVWKGLKPLA